MKRFCGLSCGIKVDFEADMQRFIDLGNKLLCFGRLHGLDDSIAHIYLHICDNSEKKSCGC